MTQQDDDSFVDRKIGDYRLQKVIGKGGHAIVHRALDLKTGAAEVAIKLLKPAVAGDEDLQTRLMREAIILAGIQHPNLVQVLTCGKDPEQSQYYLVMELLQGETLQQRLMKGPLEPDEALRRALDLISAALTLAKHGLVHRDIKASNVFLAEVYKGQLPTITKLMDLGIAYDHTERITENGKFVGTVHTASPEQLDRQIGLAVGPKSDGYQICLLLYYMLTGVQLYTQTDPNEMRSLQKSDYRPELDKRLSRFPAVLRSCIKAGLARDPAERPELHELERTLRHILHRMTTGFLARQRLKTMSPTPYVAVAPITQAVPSKSRLVMVVVGIVAGAAALAVSVLHHHAAKKREPNPAPVGPLVHNPPPAPPALSDEERQRAREALLRGVTPLFALPGGEFWMGRADAEIAQETAEMRRLRPKKYFDAVAPKLRRQVRHQVYQPPVKVEGTEISRQQGVNLLNWLPGVHEVREKTGELLHRWIVDEHGRKLFDNIEIKGMSECIFKKEADGKWSTTPECELMPLDKITPYGAKMYCEAIGRHVITAQEWEWAAKGKTNYLYPWGNKRPNCAIHSFDQKTNDPAASYKWDAESECSKDNPQPRSVRDDTSDKSWAGVKFLFGNDAEITSTPFVDSDKPNENFVEVRGTSILSPRELGMTSYRSKMPAEDARIQTTTRCAE